MPFVKFEEDFIQVLPPDDVYDIPEPVLTPRSRCATCVWDMFESFMLKYKERNCLGVREVLKKSKDRGPELGEYMWVTYGTLLELAENAGSSLALMGVKKNELCALFGCNTPEYMVAMFGCCRQGCIPVPLPYWASSTQLAKTIRKMKMRVVMCNATLLPRFVTACEILEREDVPMTVKAVVIIRSAPGSQEKLPEGYVEEQVRRFKWRSVLTWDSFLASGRKHKKAPHTGSFDDIFGVFHTSGTMGDSKAVAISNRAVMFACDSMCFHPALHTEEIVEYNSIYFAYVGSLAFTLAVMRMGGCTGFPSYPNVRSETFFDDIKRLAPTHINSTPEFIFNTISMAREVTQKGSTLERTVFKRMLDTKKEGSTISSLLSSTAKRRMGGRLQYVNTSGSFLSPEALAYAKSVLNCEIIQSYGQAEYFGCGLVTPKSAKDTSTERYASTSSGFPFPGTVVRLATVDDGSQFSIKQNPPTGEIFLNSQSMFRMYLGDEEETNAVLDDEGWFRTGDVGQLNPDGSVSIIARLKEDFKRSNGFFAQCSMLNQAYSMSSLCKHVFTYVRRDVSFTVAVVEADVKALDDCAMLPSSAREISAKARDHPRSSIAKKMLKMPEIEDLFIREFARIAKDNNFSEFEVVRGVILDYHEWSAENGLLTGSGKLCQYQLLKKFQKNLDELTEKLLVEHPELIDPRPKEDPIVTFGDPYPLSP